MRRAPAPESRSRATKSRPEARCSYPALCYFRCSLRSLPPAEAEYGLEYVDREGASYGLYRLREGEALYSAVVVRFTGRTRAQDVNAYALELARENGIVDVSDMPVGQPVRIPFDELLPEFLPIGHPRRLEYEQARAESGQYSNPVRAKRLEGITVIVDPGHGGQDPGTIRSGVWESVHVYDIALRVRKILLDTTAAEVSVTTNDGNGFAPAGADRLPPSRRHAVLTEPRYPIEDAKVGVNLRWYLANSVHRRAAAASGDADKTVFVSIHAESLHPSIRGAMAYIPAAGLTKGEFGRTEAVYRRRREVREKPRLSFPWKQRVRSEGLSRELAESILAQFRRRGLAVHHQKPVRDRIIRGRGWTFVPAVIRYNAVPAKLLLEVCNLNNRHDLALIQTRRYRQEVAQAVVDGILDYYGEGETKGGSKVAGNSNPAAAVKRKEPIETAP